MADEASRPPRTSTAGRLLVAAPLLDDPNFRRSVVMMLSHDPSGALGLVLSRIDAEIPSDVLAPWVERSASPRSVFAGGPVQTDGLIGLASVPSANAHHLVAEEFASAFVPLGDRTLVTVDLARSADDFIISGGGFDVVELRVFRGYSGWGPGQLDHELARGGWIVVPARASDPFDDDPDSLWHRVLRRQRGRLAWLGTFPEDPSLN